MSRRFRSFLSAGIALILAAEAAVQPVFADGGQAIDTVSFANVSTALTVGEAPDFTAYLTGDALLHASILNEGWACTADMSIHASKTEGLPVPDEPTGVPYSYVIALTADSGWYFPDEITLYYDDTPISPDEYTASVTDDGTVLILLCDFIPQVTPLAPDAQEITAVEILDAVLQYADGDAPRFEAVPAEPAQYALLYERWTDDFNPMCFITNNEAFNQQMGLADENRLTAFAAFGQYHYDLCITAEYGYVFADDVTVFVNGTEIPVYGHTPDCIPLNDVAVMIVPEQTEPVQTTTTTTEYLTETTTESTEYLTETTTYETSVSTEDTSFRETETTAAVTTESTEALTVEYNPDLLYGDLNQDGRISVSDAVLMMRLLAEDHSFTLTEAGVCAADINSDGMLTILDYAALVRLVQEAAAAQPVIPPMPADFGEEETELPDPGDFTWLMTPEGNSAAFTEYPRDGLTVSAEENALSYDGQLSFRDLTDDEAHEATERAEEAGCLMVDAWHIDAGLTPDEHLPGQYQCAYDLTNLGIPAEMYEDVTVLRLADDGTMQEYVTDLDGSTLHWASDQNSVVMMAIIIIGSGAIVYCGIKNTIDEYTEKAKEQGQSIDFYKTSHCTIYYQDMEKPEVKEARKKRIAEIKQEAMRQAKEYADERLADSWGGFAGLFVNYENERNRLTADRLSELLRDNAEYHELMELENGHPPDVVLLARQYELAESYLRWHERCPALNYKPDVLFTHVFQSDNNVGEAKITSYMLQNYILIKRTLSSNNTHVPKDREYFDLYDSEVPASVADKILPTLAHEMFHLMQAKKLAPKNPVNQKFFEMSAIVVETRSAAYYQELGYIQGHVLDIGESYDTFALPMDKCPLVFTQENNDLQSAAGYTMARFWLFIAEKKNNKPDVTGWQMILGYKKYGTISGMINQLFGFADAVPAGENPNKLLDVYWKAYQKSIELVALGTAADDLKRTKDDGVYFPSLVKQVKMSADDPWKYSWVKDSNLACTLAAVRGEAGCGFSVVLKRDDNFGEMQPAFQFMVPSQKGKPIGEESAKGLVMTHTAAKNDDGILYYRERQDTGSVGGSGYEIYYVPAPATPDVDVDFEAEKLTVNLKSKPSISAERGMTDCFLLVCNVDGRDTYTLPIEYADWEKEIIIPFSSLLLTMGQSNAVQVTVCELIRKEGEFPDCRTAPSKPFECNMNGDGIEKELSCWGTFGTASASPTAHFILRTDGSFRFTADPVDRVWPDPDAPEQPYTPPSEGESGNPFDDTEIIGPLQPADSGKAQSSGFTVTGNIYNTPEETPDPRNWTALIETCSVSSFSAYYKDECASLDIDVEQEWSGSGFLGGTVQLETKEDGRMRLTVIIATENGNIELGGWL